MSASRGLADRSTERQFATIGEKSRGRVERLKRASRVGDDLGGRARPGPVVDIGIGVSVGERGEGAADVVGSGRRHATTWPRVRI
ncbi:hypothetical protein [Haloferax marisrubri]|uniref:hypothetical protein n=1 Tax=Haloferax marisrubri TaxID=1544719 RepID=UPI001E608BE7|nr:hypothetical protein [Haloferax marisrubri]